MASTTSNLPDAGQILRARAEALSRLLEPVSAHQSLEVLEFRLAGECYAVETRQVRETYPFKDVTPLPCTPPFMLGVVNVRGRVVPVIDIKKFLAMPETGLMDLHDIVLLQSGDLELGLLVDAIAQVRRISVDALQPAHATLSESAAGYIKGITAERLVVLDVNRMLADPRLIVHEQVEN